MFWVVYLFYFWASAEDVAEGFGVDVDAFYSFDEVSGVAFEEDGVFFEMVVFVAAF